jgi:gamma-glutamyltranspeptidase/glutathione hydrolase
MPISMGEQIVTRCEASGRLGMVTAKHPLVAELGLRVMQRGGNAIDAAVAMGFATGVAEPLMSGLGGGGFMTIHTADGRDAVVDYQVRAPLAAREDLYELTPAFHADAQGFVGVKDDANYSGHRAVAVPGLTSGLCTALAQFGTRPLPELLDGAISLAEEGYPVTWYTTLTLASNLALLRRFPATAATFLNDGLPFTAGAEEPVRFRQPQLAHTLRRIADEGPAGFYTGPTARAIADEMERGGGLIGEADLARYAAKVVEPYVGEYRGRRFICLPAPASGAILLEDVQILDGFDLPSMGHNSVEALHLRIEAMRRGHADRLAVLGDPEVQEVPWQGLTSRAYAEARRASIRLDRHLDGEPGDPWAFSASLRHAIVPSLEGDGGCTTHFSALDAAGNAAAVTQTLTSGWGSGVTVPGAGILLNNAMTLFDPRPGAANSIAAGKRPASSMAHTIVLEHGEAVLIAGAPGGRRILDTVTQVLLNVLDDALGVQEAVSAPLVDTSEPARTGIDRRIREQTRERLAAMGHSFVVREPGFQPRYFASPSAISRDLSTGAMHGGADPYAQGVAAGLDGA